MFDSSTPNNIYRLSYNTTRFSGVFLYPKAYKLKYALLIKQFQLNPQSYQTGEITPLYVHPQMYTQKQMHFMEGSPSSSSCVQ